MDLHLAGKVAIVTGASRGIGLAVAEALVAENVKVAVGSRESSEELTELASQGQVHIVLGDLTTAEGAARLVAETVRTYGQLDILINNVGALHPRLEGFFKVTDQDWLWAWETNFLSAVRITRAALPHLQQSAPSTIVTVSSINASRPSPAVMDYSAAKAALSNFCKSLSVEVGPQGVRVNTISPGPVETPLWLGDEGLAETVGRASSTDPAWVAAQAVAGTATGRFTRPEEVANLAVLLASPMFGNVTGADIRIDGGLVSTV